MAIDLFAAERYQLDLLGVCCSASWVDAIVCPAPGGGWQVRTELYPPGGDKTGMKTCPQCRRVSPPDGVRKDAKTCGDCVIEGQERAFAEHREQLRRAGHANILPAILRRWWRRAIPPADFMDNPTVKHGNYTDAGGELSYQYHEGDGLYFDMAGHELGDSDGPRRRDGGWLSVEIALRRLNPPEWVEQYKERF